MQLPPGAMVHQAEKLRDESRIAPQETLQLHDETQELAVTVGSLRDGAREDAEVSKLCAISVKEELGSIQSLRNKTDISARKWPNGCHMSRDQGN